MSGRSFLCELVNAYVEKLGPMGGKALHMRYGSTDVECHLLFWGTGVPGAATNTTPAASARGAAPGALYLRFDNATVYYNTGSETSATWTAFTNASGDITATSLTTSATGAAITIGDAGNVVLGGTTGTKIGTSATAQKLGFFNATPVVQPTSASQAAVTATQDTLTDSSGGAASTTLASISDTATKNAVASLNAQLVKIKADIAALIVQGNRWRTDAIALGLEKGS
jgi:hypothetical protein